MSMESQSHHSARADGVRQSSAAVVEFMLASPSDVEPLHDEVQRAVLRWNRAHGRFRNVVVRVDSFKTDVAPEVDRHRAQNIPNRRLLPRCEVLLAIFWTRIGNPTGRYESGTVEEIARHTAAGKRVMIYFVDFPAPPSTLDLDQIRRLSKLREEWSTRACVRLVASSERLEDVLYADLENLMNGDEYAALGSELRSSGRGKPERSDKDGPQVSASQATSQKEESCDSAARQPSGCRPHAEIEAEAAVWIVRVDGGSMSSEENAALKRFLDKDPRHLAAYLRLQTAWQRADSLRRLRPLDGKIDPDLLARKDIQP
jgi:hypothetical protein